MIVYKSPVPMQRVLIQPPSLDQLDFDVVLERGYLKRVVSDLKMSRFAKRYVVISSKKAYGRYGRRLSAQLKRDRMFLGKLIVISRDDSKSFEQLQGLMQQMVSLGVDKESGVIALGGGIVSDLAGMCALLFASELPLIHIPTTVTAMVSSSVSCFSQLHLAEKRNIVSHRVIPRKVFIDVEVLQSLSLKVWKSGLCAVLRYAILLDRSLWDFVEEHLETFKKSPKDFLPSDFVVIEDVIHRCIELRSIVFEKGSTSVMKYGKELADVIVSDDRFDWGESLAVAMRLMGDLAVRLGYLRNEELVRYFRLFDELKLGKKRMHGLVADFVKEVCGSKEKIDLVLISRLGSVKQYMGKPFTPVEKRVLKHVLLESQLIDNVESSEFRAPSLESGWQSNHSYGVRQDITSNAESYQKSWKEQQGSYGGQVSYADASWSNKAERTDSYDDQRETRSVNSYSPSGGFENPLNVDQSETDLQRRLREMREKREKRQRDSSTGSGLSGGGGFLPG
jgi:3-dehydroquinate synthase